MHIHAQHVLVNAKLTFVCELGRGCNDRWSEPLEPRPVAIALRYDPEKGELPRVTARGRGRIAERIIALARQAGVPVRADPDLAQLLVRLEAGSAIPVEAFAAVAEILALLYRENARLAASPAGGMR